MLAMLLAASLAAPVPKAKEVEFFYPTTVGTKRVVKVKRGIRPFEYIEAVDKAEEKDGVHTVTVKLGQDVFTYLVSSKGLSCLSPLDDDPTPNSSSRSKRGGVGV